MTWDSGYAATWRVFRVNPETWEDADELDGVTSVNVVKDSDSDLREDGTIELRGDFTAPCWVRLVLFARSPGWASRADVATQFAIPPSRTIGGTGAGYELTCWSVLKPADDYVLETGWYAPAGADPVFSAYELLQARCVCPVEVPADSGIRLKTAMVAEDNETALSMAIALLENTGWDIRISPRGVVSIEAEGDTPTATHDLRDNDTVKAGIGCESDLYDVPNVIVAVEDGVRVEARNEDADSVSSVGTLGWERQQVADGSPADGETLLEFANAALEEASRNEVTLDYECAFDPEVTPGDVVRFRLGARHLEGDYRVTQQQFDATTEGGVTVQEHAHVVKQTWRR